ncbi:late competence development ComFB family protein [Halioxenophilus sp. WMMB6]|uniref:late competence development ComFB family protein n=1 Tax=Halioxenophilus sp. WMMB6 TaxID=3073815 RepID=UPI00295E9298|nr:late competence development ComFB family protein [Halioxenophilus sp. WMMB6]
MLLQTHPHNHPGTTLDSIHNFYEKLVIAEVAKQSERARSDGEFLADVACVALNHLPPRYIRYDVDMTFFLSPQEQQEIQDKVVSVVSDAVKYVSERARPEPLAVSDSNG